MMEDDFFCHACGWRTTEDQLFNFDQWTFCIVCFNTRAGSAFLYPDQYPEADVLLTAAWNTNYLASLIKQQGGTYTVHL